MSFEVRNFTKSLFETQEGHFISNLEQKISYPDDGSDLCFVIEDNSFWFKHRKACILEIVKHFPPPNLGPIFDVGGGNGFMTKAFQDSGYPSVLVEPSAKGIQNARDKRKLKHIINSSFEEAHFLPNSLPAVSAFDVVEHIEKDNIFLKKIYDALQIGGKLYITVPAYNWLWSSADDLGGHYRRYTCASINRLLAQVGFRVDFSTYIFRFLPPAIFMLRSLPYRIFKKELNMSVEQNKKDHELKENKATSILEMLLSSELNNIKLKSRMHFGGSCLVSCVKAS